MSWVYAVTALVVTLALVPLLARLAPRLGLLDHPDSRKQHEGAIPLVGGIAMASATAITTATFGLSGTMPWSFYVLSLGILILGVADDRIELGSIGRFAVQALGITLCLYSSGVQLNDLGQLVGPFTLTLGIWALPFTAFGILGIVNAINLSDGLDGLAGAVSLTVLINFYIAATIAHGGDGDLSTATDPRTHIAILSATVIGFLYFNARTPLRQKAKVFMGDAGSLFLGINIGFLSILVTSHPSSESCPPVAALWILAVPLFDTVGCMARRIIQGYSPMMADRKHMHHLILTKGLTVQQTVAAMALVNLTSGVLALIAWRAGLPDWLMFAAFLTAFAGYAKYSISEWKAHDERASKSIPAPVTAETSETKLPAT